MTIKKDSHPCSHALIVGVVLLSFFCITGVSSANSDTGIDAQTEAEAVAKSYMYNDVQHATDKEEHENKEHSETFKAGMDLETEKYQKSSVIPIKEASLPHSIFSGIQSKLKEFSARNLLIFYYHFGENWIGKIITKLPAYQKDSEDNKKPLYIDFRGFVSKEDKENLATETNTKTACQPVPELLCGSGQVVAEIAHPSTGCTTLKYCESIKDESKTNDPQSCPVYNQPQCAEDEVVVYDESNLGSNGCPVAPYCTWIGGGEIVDDVVTETPELIFQVAVLKDAASGNDIDSLWKSASEVQVSETDILHFKWNGSGFATCFANLHPETYFTFDTAAKTGNTWSLKADLRTVNATYSVECKKGNISEKKDIVVSVSDASTTGCYDDGTYRTFGTKIKSYVDIGGETVTLSDAQFICAADGDWVVEGIDCGTNYQLQCADNEELRYSPNMIAPNGCPMPPTCEPIQ